jgi:hypothetical protein
VVGRAGTSKTPQLMRHSACSVQAENARETPVNDV